jgi:hypothetical protein
MWYTLPVCTAVGGTVITLHFHISGGGKGRNLQVFIASSGN